MVLIQLMLLSLPFEYGAIYTLIQNFQIQYFQNTIHTILSKLSKKVQRSAHLLTSDTNYGENLCRTLTRRNRPTIKIISEIEKFSVDCDGQSMENFPSGSTRVLHV